MSEGKLDLMNDLNSISPDQLWTKRQIDVKFQLNERTVTNPMRHTCHLSLNQPEACKLRQSVGIPIDSIGQFVLRPRLLEVYWDSAFRPFTWLFLTPNNMEV